jgi:beta-glucanase (GH16 family)
VALAAFVAGLILFGFATPTFAATKRRVTATATATVSAAVSVKTSRTATVVATMGTPPRYFTGSAASTSTVRASATARASGSATVTGTGSLSRLRSQARALALARAKKVALSRARASASAKATSASASKAQAAATALAKSRAIAAAHAVNPTGSLVLAVVATGAASAPCGGTLPKAGGGTWVCTFSDEFTGSALDPRKWTALTTQATGYRAGDSCFVNSPSNVAVSAGALHLTVRKTVPFTCHTGHGDVTTTQTAANVASIDKFSQTYGRFAVRAKFPATTIAGLQASLWLWPQSYTYGMLWPLSGEIDIAEEYSIHPDRAIPYVHYLFDPATVDLKTNTNVTTNNNCLVTNVGAYHQYAVEWTPTSMTITFDGKTCLVNHWLAVGSLLTPLLGSAPFNQPFFLALTQAVGDGTNAYQPGTTPLPGTTTIDWVRVWK